MSIKPNEPVRLLVTLVTPWCYQERHLLIISALVYPAAGPERGHVRVSAATCVGRPEE